jgi:acyl carrier protein
MEDIVEDSVVAGQIRSFLIRQFPLIKNVGDEQPLLGGGLIDSLGILDVVSFLESEFNIAVADEELLPKNFGTVRSLAMFVQQKTNGTRV